MVKRGFLSIVGVLLICLVSGQTFFHDFTLGPKVGLNFGSPVPFGNIPEGASGKVIPGVKYGLTFQYNIAPKWSVTMGTLFNQKSAHFSTPLDSMPIQEYQEHPFFPEDSIFVETFFYGNAEGAFDNFYFEVPIVVNYHLDKNWRVGFGWYYARLRKSKTWAEAEGTVGYDPKVQYRKLDYKSSMRKIDHGPLMEVKYTMKDRFDFGVQLSYGLKSVFNDDFYYIDYSVNNFFAQISVASRFGFVKKNKEGKEDLTFVFQ